MFANIVANEAQTCFKSSESTWPAQPPQHLKNTCVELAYHYYSTYDCWSIYKQREMVIKQPVTGISSLKQHQQDVYKIDPLHRGKLLP
jgi:hypothetical protein